MAAKAAKAAQAALAASSIVAMAQDKEVPSGQAQGAPIPLPSTRHEEIDLDKLISQYSTPSDAMQVDSGDSHVKKGEPYNSVQDQHSPGPEGQVKLSVVPSSGSPAKAPIPASTSKPLANNVSMSRVGSLQASNASMSEGEIFEEPPRAAKPPSAPKAPTATAPSRPKDQTANKSNDNQKSRATQLRQDIGESYPGSSLPQSYGQNPSGLEVPRTEGETRSDMKPQQLRDYRDERQTHIRSEPGIQYGRRASRDQIEKYRQSDIPQNKSWVPSLEQLLPHDQTLKEWLEVSGYHDIAYRDKVLNCHRRIAEIDAERSKLIAEIAADSPIKGIQTSVTPTIALIAQSREELQKRSGWEQEERPESKKRPYSDMQDFRDTDGSKVARIEGRPPREENDDWRPQSSDLSPRRRSSGDDRLEDREYDRFRGHRERSESPSYGANEAASTSRSRNQDYRDDWPDSRQESVGRSSYWGRNYDASYRGRGRGKGRSDRDFDEYGDNPGPFPREELRPQQSGQQIAARKPYKDPRAFKGRRGGA